MILQQLMRLCGLFLPLALFLVLLFSLLSNFHPSLLDRPTGRLLAGLMDALMDALMGHRLVHMMGDLMDVLIGHRLVHMMDGL